MTRGLRGDLFHLGIGLSHINVAHGGVEVGFVLLDPKGAHLEFSTSYEGGA